MENKTLIENKIIIENSLLNNEDKIILNNLLERGLFYSNSIFNLSIFSKLGKNTTTIDLFNYLSYKNNFCYYYKKMNIWLDNELKLLPYSNWWCNTDLKRFIENINNYLIIIKNINIDNAIYKEGEYISITKWFVTYGHFLDEVFTIKYFQTKNDFKNKIPLISFNIDNNNIYGNKNYKDYCDLLFNKYYDVDENLIKVNNLIIIKHLYNDTYFHSFPLEVSNYICNKLIYQQINPMDKYIFITRGIDPPHLKRNLSNKNEIEKFLLDKNIDIFNPEEHSIITLIKKIKSYNYIIITWGSALTNLCFCNENSNVIILKSLSYEHETINLFNKIIDSRKLKIQVLDSINNIVDLKRIDNIINTNNNSS